MFVVGLTGGIGSGKSTVASLFAEHGVPIIDADVIAKEITTPDKPAFSAIVKHMGQVIVRADGSLDRAKLRQLIFSDPTQRLWLERLLHPLILEEMRQQIANKQAPYCIAVIPLLLEVEFFSLINRILVVDASESTQIKRVMLRDKLSQQDIDAILQTQANRDTRLAKAQDIITNNGSLETLTPQVDRLHLQYVEMSEKNMRNKS